MKFCREYLAKRRSDGLYRAVVETKALDAVRVLREGRECLLLCGNDYLGLTQHPALAQKAQLAAQEDGVGAGGSRLISGSHPLCQALERDLAAWKETEAALVFSSGYAANVGTISALVGAGDAVFSDRLNHASIIDGCRLSGAAVSVYEHLDLADLAQKLAAHKHVRRRLIVTDGVFSMDGDVAPLDKLAALAQANDAMLMVDDAHALGTLGEGRGTAHHFGVGKEVAIQLGTLSKSLAGVGGYVAASHEVVSYLVNCSRSFIFSTAPSPMTLAAAREALAVLRREPQHLAKLQANGQYLRQTLRAAGLPIPDGETPILPLLLGSASAASEMSKRLESAAILVSAIRPPTVPHGESRLRLTVSAAHSRTQLEYAAREIIRCWLALP